MSQSVQFLRNPAEIRRALHSLASSATSLDLAVAFVGAEWQRLLGHYNGPIRAVCWLSHPATDPDAVETMMKRAGSKVLQRDGLHAKVYLVRGVGAVVGSANLSRAALSDASDAKQSEAAVLVTAPADPAVITKWFDEVWADRKRTRGITSKNLEQARKNREKCLWPFTTPATINKVPPLPDPMPSNVVQLAKSAADIPIAQNLKPYRQRLDALLKKRVLSPADVSDLCDAISKWTGHPAVYKRLERQSRDKTLRGLKILFDEGRSVYDRLTEIRQKKLLKGLLIPTMSLLLYWWMPEAYPPFNEKTKTFLEDFGMKSQGMSAASPACYATWLVYADNLRAKLKLPSTGHVDRVAAKYYDAVKLKEKRSST